MLPQLSDLRGERKKERRNILALSNLTTKAFHRAYALPKIVSDFNIKWIGFLKPTMEISVLTASQLVNCF